MSRCKQSHVRGSLPFPDLGPQQVTFHITALLSPPPERCNSNYVTVFSDNVLKRHICEYLLY